MIDLKKDHTRSLLEPTLYWLAKQNELPSHTESIVERKSIIIEIESSSLLYLNDVTQSQDDLRFILLLTTFDWAVKRYFWDCRHYKILNHDLKNFVVIETNFSFRDNFKGNLLRQKTKYSDLKPFCDYDTNRISLESYAKCSLSFNVDTLKSQFDQFELNIVLNRDSATLTFIYNPEFIIEYTAKSFLNYYKHIIDQLEHFVKDSFCDYSFLLEEDEKTLSEVNNTTVSFPADKTIIDLFEVQTVSNSESIAIRSDGNEISYKDFNITSNQFADYLIKRCKVKKGDIVAVDLNRSIEMMYVIFGIIKAGAAYLPIDTNLPEHRKNIILKDANPIVCIKKEYLTAFNKDLSKYNSNNPDVGLSPTDLIYIIYTSGTTGDPKGVMVEHGGIVNRLYWMQKAYPLTKDDILIQKTNYAFDVSVWEIFWWALFGASVYIPIVGAEKDPESLVQEINKSKATVIHFVPSMFEAFLGYLRNDHNKVGYVNSLKQFFSSGEALAKSSVYLFYNIFPEKDLMNLYGPTEASIDVSFYDCKKTIKNINCIPIGKPIDNTSLYILDVDLNPVPIGVTGRLYISGVGLSRGYLNKPELTAEKFIDNPFDPGAKMYDTGDLARWLSDGNIEFLGRCDFQIKIRGNRVELGDIENAILQYGHGIYQSVVTVNNEQDSGLVGYFATKGGKLDKSLLKLFLQRKLPKYMVPSHFVEMDHLPLTSNGKIDRRALPSVSSSDLVWSNYVAPSTEIEFKVVEIWQSILKVEKIGLADNFFDLGGHSLLIGQVINRINKELSLSLDFKTFFNYPTISEQLLRISEQKFNPIEQIHDLDNYVLSSAQERMWILSQLDGGSTAYNMSTAFNLKGNFDISILELSFRRLISRHEILRTVFRLNELGEVKQYIQSSDSILFSITKIEFHNKDNTELKEYLRQESRKKFDLENGPLLKVNYIKSLTEEIIFISMHHIIGDGWSNELMISEVVEHYNTIIFQGVNSEIPLMDKVQYKDYVKWFNTQKVSEGYQKSRKYWLDQFSGDLPVLELPTFKNRPSIKTFKGRQLKHNFGHVFFERLKELSEVEGTTLFMVLMAGVRSLIYKYTDQEDIIIGTPIAGREHPDLERQLGLFLNTLAIRTKLDNNNTFHSILLKERDALLGAYDHKLFAFDELVQNLPLNRDLSRSPLFDVMVVLHNQKDLNIAQGNKELSGIELTPYEFQNETSHFDLSFIFTQKKGSLELILEYNTDIYDEFLITRIFDHFENFMSECLDDRFKSIENINYLSVQEIDQQFREFNNRQVDYPKDKTVIQLFEEQVLSTPDNIAVVFENMEVSYKYLNENANRLAHYLRIEFNILPEELIAIKLDRSSLIIEAILGILKSGGAYVPIDPDYPKERIDYILNDINAKLVIDEKFFRDHNLLIANYPNHNPISVSSCNNLAYVIYTSGTTGKPKGVMIENISILNLVYSYMPQRTQYSLSLTCNYNFDVSVLEIFSTLLFGSTLYIPDKETVLSPSTYANYIIANNISHCYLHPMTLREISKIFELKEYKGIQKLLIGVEPIKFENIKYFLNYGEVINGYGPTESTVCSTFYYVKNNLRESDILPIGSSLPNVQVYILDNSYVPVPIGKKGKLYISGIGMSRGYLNLPELTNSKFQNLRVVDKEIKVYDTGDIVRYLPDGSLEFCGRNDYQMKIRGLRIESSEIEYHIVGYSTNIKAAIVDLKVIKAEKYLVGYYINDGKGNIDKNDLRRHLKTKLPDYMIPNYFIELSSFPLTSNGKINRKELPDMTDVDRIGGEIILPLTEIEIKVAEIWKLVLQIDQISLNDNFFDLGGNSMMIMKVISLYESEFGKSIKIKDFYELNSLKDHIAVISILERTERSEMIEIQNNEISITAEQYRFLKKYENPRLVKEDLLSGLYELGESINPIKLEKSLRSVCDKNIALRSFLNYNEDKISLDFHKAPIIIKKYNIYDCKNFVKKRLKQGIDITRGLANIYILQSKQNVYYLGFILNHIIFDAYSEQLFKTFLFKDYHGIQYISGDYIHFLNFTNTTKWNIVGKKYIEMWEDICSQSHNISFKINESNKAEIKSDSSTSLNFLFDVKTTSLILNYVANHQLSQTAFFLAVFGSIFRKRSNQTKFSVSVSSANRSSKITENVIGLVRNPVLMNLSALKLLDVNNIKQFNREFIEFLSYQNVPISTILDRNPDLKELVASLSFVNLFNISDKETGENFKEFKSIKLEKRKSITSNHLVFYLTKGQRNTINLRCLYNIEKYKKDEITMFFNELSLRINTLLNKY